MVARIFPTYGPREFEQDSQEDEIYYALRDRLPEDYVVIHSFKYRKLHNHRLVEHESDFVVYNKNLGILCIEAKGGKKISYRDSSWLYSSGSEFKHDPYDQAADAMHQLVTRIKKEGRKIQNCMILSAVWFPGTTRQHLEKCPLPAHAVRDFTLTYEDLENPEVKIKSIFNACANKRVYNSYRHDYQPDYQTALTDSDDSYILNEVLLPQFDIIEAPKVRMGRVEKQFVQLLDSQTRILDFLVDQRSAVINGAAGTGKTMIAIERAVQLACEGERSLFLCVNRLLKRDVEEKIKERGFSDYVKVMTVSGLALSKTGSYTDYEGLKRWLDASSNDFYCKHLIIDEGQDFGMKAIAVDKVLDSLYLRNLDYEDGSFYVFYDARQLIQGIELPELIRNADCKMTLYINCRNTKNISDCSINGLNRKGRHKLKEGSPIGDPPKFVFSDNRREIEAFIDEEIKRAKEDGISAADMVVLTCSTIENTRHTARISDSKKYEDMKEWGTTKVPVYTCREFKGLEADVVFLVDVDKSVWEQDSEYQAPPGLLFYTGASRARHQLYVAVEMAEEDAADVADILEGVDNRHRKRPFIKLENILRKSL